MRVIPSLPQRGRQTKGSIPLTPPISPVSQENFSSTSDKLSHFFKFAPVEGIKATIAIAQKKHQNNFSLISAEVKKSKKL